LQGPNGDVSGSMLGSRIGTQSKFVGSNPFREPPPAVTSRAPPFLRLPVGPEGGVIPRWPIAFASFPHAPEGIPDCGSFEVWFADGRPSTFFYWEDNPGRASTTRKMNRSRRAKQSGSLPGQSSKNFSATHEMRSRLSLAPFVARSRTKLSLWRGGHAGPCYEGAFEGVLFARNDAGSTA